MRVPVSRTGASCSGVRTRSTAPRRSRRRRISLRGSHGRRRLSVTNLTSTCDRTASRCAPSRSPMGRSAGRMPTSLRRSARRRSDWAWYPIRASCRSSALPSRRTRISTRARSGRRRSATNGSAMRTSSTRFGVVRTCGSTNSAPPSPAVGAPTLTSRCRQNRPRKRVQAAIAAGGRIVDDRYAPKWWTIASPDNHGVDIAGWADTEA